VSVEQSAENAAPPAPVTDLAAASVPQFRAIGAGSQRRGLRLERIFWDSLDALAERRKQKRAALIAKVLHGTDDNAASRLRCYIVMEVEAERRDLVERTDAIRSIKMMQQAPVPAFAITRQKRIQQVNSEFMQFLKVASGNASGNITPELVHLSLDTAIEELFNKLISPPFSAFCGYSLTIDNNRRRGRVKVVPVPFEPVDVLVGYIIS
jgi:predicted DNA-binding ribbon-helix-helix protein